MFSRNLARTPKNRWALMLVASSLLCLALVATKSATSWWALALTLTQSFAMQGCARDKHWGWSIALVLQAPWAAYAIITLQLPFLLTCVLCSYAQVTALQRLPREPLPDKVHVARDPGVALPDKVHVAPRSRGGTNAADQRRRPFIDPTP